MNEKPSLSTSVDADPWASLRNFTAARIALGRTGVSEPLNQSLQFKLAHALAKDSVYSELNVAHLVKSIGDLITSPVYSLHTKVHNRQEYLQRPDLGRRLDEPSVQQLERVTWAPADIALMIADGLSANAIHTNALSLLQILIPALQSSHFTLAPVTVVQQARVAVSDEIGFILKANVSLILIGERPGLSSPDSMGAYFTYQPKLGLTDESRNCISNIRPAGLPPAQAAEKLLYLMKEAIRLKISGVQLKDHGYLLPE